VGGRRIIKEDEVGGTSSPRGGTFTGFSMGGPKVRDHWEDEDVGGRITLRWTLGM
jgi:hypothetical protein